MIPSAKFFWYQHPTSGRSCSPRADLDPYINFRTKKLKSISLATIQSKTLEAVQRRACQITVGGGTYSSNCSSHKLDSLHTRRQQQTKKTVQSDRQQAGTLPTLPVSCLQQENHLSLIVSDLPTNCLAYLHICYSLNSSQCECCFFLSDCVIQPYNNRLI